MEGPVHFLTFDFQNSDLGQRGSAKKKLHENYWASGPHDNSFTRRYTQKTALFVSPVVLHWIFFVCVGFLGGELSVLYCGSQV